MSIVLAILEGEDAGREFVFDSLPILVGRTEACHVILYHPSISRRHCRFYKEDDRIFIEDLRSINGTFVNGVPVILNSALGPGDIVGMGSLKFRFDTLDATEPTVLQPRRNGLRHNTTGELTTVDRLVAVESISTPAPFFPQETPPAFSSLGKVLTKDFETHAEDDNLLPNTVSGENVLAEILPEEIEGILPEELFTQDSLFEEGFFEEKFPEELLAEETLAREHVPLQSLFEETPFEQPTGDFAHAPETQLPWHSFSEEKPPEKNGVETRVENEVEKKPGTQCLASHQVFEQMEQSLIEQIAAEQQWLAQQSLEEERLAMEKLSQEMLTAQVLIGRKPSKALRRQLYADTVSRYVLKHPILFTLLGCVLCVLIALIFSH